MKYSILVFLLLLGIQLQAQRANHYKRLFIDAEYYLLFNEYREALPLYLEIYNSKKDNANIAYRLGECYLNITAENSNAIRYLELATEDITENYDLGYYTESKAPLRAILLLGIAYRVDEKLEKALETFNRYKQRVEGQDNESMSEVNYQIQICYNAMDMKEEPVEFTTVNQGRGINSSFANIRPAVTLNDSAIAFTTRLQFYDAVFFSKRKEGEWSFPTNLTPYFQADGDIHTCAISGDGNLLILVRKDRDDFNLYYSEFKNNQWGLMQKFGNHINTKFNETHASISPDGNTLYFVSDRNGGYGGKDIYKTTRTKDNEWGPAKNLGPAINTPRDEETPFVTMQETLFFSSKGHYNMGGFDIFKARYNLNEWDEPQNLGYPLNSTDDDVFFMPLSESEAYYAIFGEEGFGNYDIYKVQF